MEPVIFLALVDDWEVRGNGTGHPKVLQFEPMRRLVKIFNQNGIRGSFNVEVMQQITYRNLEGRFLELKPIADEWDEVVTESFRQGHDMQLHVHPQWRRATYQGPGNWKLDGDWSILHYPPSEIREMIASGKLYLESLLRAIDRRYACVTFRAGSWCAAPSDSLLPILSELGFVFDISIAPGIRNDTPQVSLDYTRCDEAFKPYYPEMTDARRVSSSVESMICIPTFTFSGARVALIRRDLGKARTVLGRKFRALRNGRNGAHPDLSQGRSLGEWTNRGESGVIGNLRKVFNRYLLGQIHIADLSRLNYSMMRRMMENIRERAAKSGLERVPVILENHTKDIHDFSHIERFARAVAQAREVKTVTLTEIAHGLRAGTFGIRTA